MAHRVKSRERESPGATGRKAWPVQVGYRASHRASLHESRS